MNYVKSLSLAKSRLQKIKVEDMWVKSTIPENILIPTVSSTNAL